MLRGVDVSDVQGNVIWAAVELAGCAFAIAKGYEGNKGLDPDFVKNIAGAKAQGLVAAAYHFPYPLPPVVGQPLHDPVAQAGLHFHSTSGFGSHDGEILFADLEWPAPEDWAHWGCSAPQLRAWYSTYLAELTRLCGRAPLIYLYPDFAAHVDFAADPTCAAYKLWMASYITPERWPAEGERPSVPKPWTEAAFWQATGGGPLKVAGMNVDADVFLGSLADLQALAGLTNVSALAQNALETAEVELATPGHDSVPPAAA